MVQCYFKIRTIAEKPFMRRILGFFDGNLYPLLYAAMVLLSSFLGLELFCFYVTMFCVLFTVLFSKDSKPLLTPLVLVIYSIGRGHTPQGGSDYFTSVPVLVSIGILAKLAVAAFVWRLIVYPAAGRGFSRGGTCFGGGLLVFAGAMILNGLFYSGEHALKELFFGALIGASFALIFIYLYNTCPERGDLGKFSAYLFFIAACVIVVQIGALFAFGGVIKEDGSINKDVMYLGWGAPNNVGGMLAMFLPAGLYLAYRCRYGILLYLATFLQFACVCLTQSRSAMLVGGAVLFAGMILLSVVKSPRRKAVRIVNIFLVACAAVGCVVFSKTIGNLFALIIDRGFDDSARFDIWKMGLKNFLREPFFGVGFYSPLDIDNPDFTYGFNTWLFPDMYHNMVVQVLACCGIVGGLALMFHFAQILATLCNRPTAERIFYFSVVFLILGTSMLENHIFHIFPALLYSAVLFLWEKDVTRGKSMPPRRRGLFGKLPHPLYNATEGTGPLLWRSAALETKQNNKNF